jgi:hypothetical protein
LQQGVEKLFVEVKKLYGENREEVNQEMFCNVFVQFRNNFISALQVKTLANLMIFAAYWLSKNSVLFSEQLVVPSYGRQAPLYPQRSCGEQQVLLKLQVQKRFLSVVKMSLRSL